MPSNQQLALAGLVVIAIALVAIVRARNKGAAGHAPFRVRDGRWSAGLWPALSPGFYGQGHAWGWPAGCNVARGTLGASGDGQDESWWATALWPSRGWAGPSPYGYMPPRPDSVMALPAA